MKSTKTSPHAKPARTSSEGPQSPGWKDTDYNEGGGLKDVGGRSTGGSSAKNKTDHRKKRP